MMAISCEWKRFTGKTDEFECNQFPWAFIRFSEFIHNMPALKWNWQQFRAREIMATIRNTDIDGDKKIGRSKANQQQNL